MAAAARRTIRGRAARWVLVPSLLVFPATAPASFRLEHVPSPSMTVAVPGGYTKGEPLPLLVLLHGHGGSRSSWLNPAKGDLRRTAEGLRAIVAMPEAGNGWYADWADGSQHWEGCFLDRMVPALERRYAIRAGRRWHAIAGLSMGGQGAVYVAARRAGYFGSVASFSGALSIRSPGWADTMGALGEPFEAVFGPPDGPYAIAHDPTALASRLRRSRVYVSVGDAGPVEAVVSEAALRRQAGDFVRAARRAGARVTYRARRGAHAWRYWRADLRDAIRRWGLFRP